MAHGDTGIKAFISLGTDINKRRGHDITPDTEEGVVSEKLPELTLEMNDEDLAKLGDKWDNAWINSKAKQRWIQQGDENEKYWLGDQFHGPLDEKSRPMVDNLIFETSETFLPLATRRNPEPMVTLRSSEKDELGNETEAQTKYISKVKNRLADLAEDNKLRLKLKRSARHWLIYLLGVAKIGWDFDRDIPIVHIIRPRKIILDPEAIIDEDGYHGDRIGEYRKLTAERILDVIGKKEDELDPETGEKIRSGNQEAVKHIKELVKDDLSTEIQFIEWWTQTFIFWKLDQHILMKKKNPHWNYDKQGEAETTVDEDGAETTVEPENIQGVNHFVVPKMPYEFLTIFNLGDQPMDKTSLIGQNLANQDRINKRNRQIDKNVDQMNGGMVVSLQRSGLTQTQAEGVSLALRKGGVITIPTGAPREAIDTYQPPALPTDVFTQLLDTRERFRDIFGVSGSSQAGLKSEETVRGKILATGLDTDRIGGGITEYLEQYGGNIYNWFLQMLYVYDEGFQFLGGGVPPRVVISVKEGSLLPKDSVSLANQAIELAGQNRLSNIDLFKILEYPNPEDLAANVWLEVNAPHLLYQNNPLVQQAILQAQQAAQAQVGAEEQGKDREQERTLAKGEADNENKLEVERLKGAQKKEERSILSRVPTK